jgi:hypothetical protein
MGEKTSIFTFQFLLLEVLEVEEQSRSGQGCQPQTQPRYWLYTYHAPALSVTSFDKLIVSATADFELQLRRANHFIGPHAQIY